MADTETKIEVLKGLKMMLKFVRLFRNDGLSIGSYWFPNSIIILLISSTLILHLGLTIWFCVEFDLDLKIISGAVSIACGTSQVQLIYFHLASYRRLVVCTVDDLENMVQRSKKIDDMKKIIYYIH